MTKTTKTIKIYTTYEEPFNNNGNGRTFTEPQIKEVYKDFTGDGTINKEEYPDFDCWLADMLKSGVFTVKELTEKATEYAIIYRDGNIYKHIRNIYNEDDAYIILAMVIKAGYMDSRIEEI